MSLHRRSRRVVCLACFMMLTAGRAGAGTVHVDCTNTAGPWDGSVANPFQTIQDGINAAAHGDEVVVRPCIYSGPGNRDLDFAGRQIMVRSIDPADPAVVAGTVIDCENAGRGFYFHKNEGAASVVDGLTIINGSGYWGAGILCYDGSSPTIRNCTVTGCQVQYDGGGICCYDGASPAIVNCAVVGNVAGVDGGGIYAYNGSNPEITNCRVTNNYAQRNGGGVYVSFGVVWLTNATMVANQAGSFGGGCLTNYGDLWMSNSIVRANAAPVGPDFAIVSQSQFGVSYSDLKGGCNAIYQEMSTILCGAGIMDADPLFVRDPDRGPDGQAATADDDCGDVCLTFGSPCVDAGDNTAVPADSTDLDGDGNTVERAPLDIEMKARFIDDPTRADAGVADPPDYLEVVDLGACEFVERHSFVRYELALGGVDHGAAGDAFFTRGDPADDRQFTTGTTITWDTVVLAGGIQSAGQGAGHTVKGVANLVFDLALYKDAVNPENLVPEVKYFSTAHSSEGAVTETRTGGIQKIVVGFDCDVSSYYTPGEVLVNGGLYTPAGEALVNNGTRLEVTFTEGQLPDEAYYHIDISASVSGVSGDKDCLVRALVGDTNTDGRTNLADMALAKLMNGSDLMPGNACHDVNLDGRLNLADMALVKLHNGGQTALVPRPAAFAYSFDVAGSGPGRIIDALADGGPLLGVYAYPTNLGDGVLYGMGAGYMMWRRSSPDSFTTAGVGQVGAPPVGDPVYGGLGSGPVCEGQLDTTALAPGTYILKLIPLAGTNVLRGDVPLDADILSFATPADATEGDEIRFVLVEGNPSCRVMGWASERFHAGDVNDWLAIELTSSPAMSSQRGGAAAGGESAQSDFGHVQACLSGPGVPFSAGCADADVDADGDVDADDLSVLVMHPE